MTNLYIYFDLKDYEIVFNNTLRISIVNLISGFLRSSEDFLFREYVNIQNTFKTKNGCSIFAAPTK